jgi:hypothetical protein
MSGPQRFLLVQKLLIIDLRYLLPLDPPFGPFLPRFSFSVILQHSQT